MEKGSKKGDAAAKWEARRAEIVFLYRDRDLSQQQMAGYYGISLRGMQKVMERLGIASLPSGRRVGKTHGNFKDGKDSVRYRKMVVKDKCSRCGATESLCIHHKNDDHYDNALENLEILCNSCHLSITKKAWWAAKRAGKPLPKSTGKVGWARKKSR